MSKQERYAVAVNTSEAWAVANRMNEALNHSEISMATGIVALAMLIRGVAEGTGACSTDRLIEMITQADTSLFKRVN